MEAGTLERVLWTAAVVEYSFGAQRSLYRHGRLALFVLASEKSSQSHPVKPANPLIRVTSTLRSSLSQLL